MLERCPGGEILLSDFTAKIKCEKPCVMSGKIVGVTQQASKDIIAETKRVREANCPDNRIPDSRL